MNNEVFMKKLNDNNIYPIETVLLGRGEGTQWSPMLLKSVDDSAVPFNMFSPDGETWGVEMIAPYKGNESVLFSEEDVYDLWDFDKLREDNSAY